MARLTPGQCIKRKCLECLGADEGGSRFDCLSEVCPLYPAHPFRGRAIPPSYAPKCGILPSEQDRAERIHRERPARRASKAIISRMCYECNPDRQDCTSETCALLPYTPFQPGGQPKRVTSAKQIAAVAKARESLPKDCAEGRLSARNAPLALFGTDTPDRGTEAETETAKGVVA